MERDGMSGRDTCTAHSRRARNTNTAEGCCERGKSEEKSRTPASRRERIQRWLALNVKTFICTFTYFPDALRAARTTRTTAEAAALTQPSSDGCWKRTTAILRVMSRSRRLSQLAPAPLQGRDGTRRGTRPEPAFMFHPSPSVAGNSFSPPFCTV